MSTKTSFKRVALVAVAALGMGVLTSVSPAKAAFATGTTTAITGDAVLRTDGASTSTLTITSSATSAATDVITVDTFTRNGVALSTIPAGVEFVAEDNWTEAKSTTAITFTYVTAGETTAQITFAKTMPTGKYTFKVTTSGTATGTATTTGTFYVVGAPTKAAFDKATYSAEGTATAAAQVSLTDVNSNPSYLISGEAVQITTSATTAISSVVLLDSGNYTATTATTGYIATNLSNNAGTAGSYTYTASGASGQTGFTSGTATLTVSAAAATVESVALATGTLARGHVTGTPSTTTRTIATGTNDTNATTSIFVSTKQTSVTYKLTDTGEAAAKNFRYSISQTSGVPFPGGIAASAAPVYLPAAVTTAGSSGISADLTIAATSALAGTGYTLTILGTSANIVYTVLYQAPVAYNVALTDSEATTIAAVKLATTSQSVKVTDQFGSAFAGAVVSYATTVRNTVAVKTAVSGADGTATVSTTDAALSTVTTDDTLTASITASNITGGANAVTSAATTIKYFATAAEIAAAAIALAVTKPTVPGTADATGQTYNSSDLAAVTTTTVTVDTNLTNGSDQLKLVDQIKIVASVTNAAAGTPQGVPVSVSGSAGVYFLAGGTVGEVLVGSQTGAATTLSSYTAAGGTYTFQAAFTKAGTATITVKSGSVTKTYSIKVLAGAAGIVKAAASANGVVVATVTDLWGNPVSGASVAFVAASGALLGGNFPSLSATTGADGTASTVVTGAEANKSYVVSATISAGDTAVVADTTNGVPAGVATVDVTSQGSGQSDLNKLTVLINSLIKKMNALATLVAKIQKKLGVK
jgi:adhesin/invasin